MPLTGKNMMQVAVTGSGIAFPEEGKWVDNAFIHRLIFGDDWESKMAAKQLDASYYENELGFVNRFWVHTPGSAIIPEELNSADLMVTASEEAIKDAGISKNEIDFIITVTITSPRYSTSMGPFVAGRLGINAPAMEMKTGCASNIFALMLAAQLIQSGARNVLIACGETNTKIMPLTSRTAYAGGDAGAAVIVSKSSSEKGFLAWLLNSDGSFSGHMGVPGLMPPTHAAIDAGDYYLQYSDSAEHFLNKVWAETPAALYEAAGITASDIDCFIPHQVNKKRTAFAIDASGVAKEKTVDILAQYANCGSATVLLALHHARKQNMLPANNGLGLLFAAGGGISWGGIILKT